MAQSAIDASRVRRADELRLDGRYAAALREAGKVHRAPARAAALVVRARTLTMQRAPGTDAAWRAVIARVPNSWQLELEWFRAILFTGGSRRHALEVYARARELNPRLPAP